MSLDNLQDKITSIIIMGRKKMEMTILSKYPVLVAFKLYGQYDKGMFWIRFKIAAKFPQYFLYR
tara:strand:- start:72 stop:263 length:192 start_codon:yes stop_codon:yes gene_type:complete